MTKYTPMMEQYFEIKKDYENCLLLYRLGDFYELFFDDAVIASKELDITLTGRECGGSQRAPMCGVPHHAIDSYVATLIEKGYKVAICEQTENPVKGQKLVKREVVRVVTAGTMLDANVLETGKNNYLACICESEFGFGFAYTDISTGEFFTAEFHAIDNEKIIDEIGRLGAKEIIVNKNYSNTERIEKLFNVKPLVMDDRYFDQKNAVSKIYKQLGIASLTGIGLEDDSFAVLASGALLEYLFETQKNLLNHILKINVYRYNNHLILDLTARRNLEITENMRDKSKKGSLLWVLDKTKTPMGARLIRKWLEQPLISENKINIRLNAVSEYKDNIFLRVELKDALANIYDIERLTSKIVYKTVNCKDLQNLKKSLERFPEIKSLLMQLDSDLNKEIAQSFDELQDIYDILNESICDEPPLSVKEGGIFKDGYNADLDKLRVVREKGSSWLLDIENKEKDETGIRNLKIRYNKIFGYYIEVTNSYKNLVPEKYIRRQTLANCERYTLLEIKEIEDEILNADEKIGNLEHELFLKIILKLICEIQRIQLAAYTIATIDVLQSFAEASDKNNYIRPTISKDGMINIVNGRHPVIEKLTNEAFVANDTILNSTVSRLSIITGPNMSGKSTFMRQNALIVLMAQIGCFVPAEMAKISITDRIFTRVGASDDLGMGQSTFMVEMCEVANILNNATQNSLIILDEIGRGTSTFDGLSIAWSVLEYIANVIGAKTLFATHYHELTELEGKVDGVINYRVMVQEKGEDIVFLRKIIRGGADNSYGIYVAKIAGVPSPVLQRSKEILLALNDSAMADGNVYKCADANDVVNYADLKKAIDYSKQKITISDIEGNTEENSSIRDTLKNM